MMIGRRYGKAWTWVWAITSLCMGMLGCPRSEPPKATPEPTAASAPVSPPPVPTPSAGQPSPENAFLHGQLPREVERGEPKQGGTLVIRLPSEPLGLSALDDRLSEGWGVRVGRATVYQTLLTLEGASAPDFNPQPCLALSVDTSADGKTQTFSLRPDVRFHDGSLFTSADVKAVLDAVRKSKKGSRVMGRRLGDIASYHASTPLTFVVRWRVPSFQGQRALALELPMVPRKWLTEELDPSSIHPRPVGTGPFRFSRWEPGASLEFVRHEAYWGDKAYLDRIIFRVVPDAAVAADLFEKGELDVMTQIPTALWHAMEAPGSAWPRLCHRIKFPENNNSWLGWNEKLPLFQDARVRRALGMAVPYAKIMESVDHGQSERSFCPYYPGSADCDPEIQPLPFDPNAAGALLDQAGWKDSDNDGLRDKEGRVLRFTFLTTSASPRSAQVAALYQETLRTVGVDLQIDRVAWESFTDRIRQKQFDVVMMHWTVPDVETDEYLLFHSDQTNHLNVVSYRNEALDPFLEASRRELNPLQRRVLKRRIHRTLFEDQPYTWLFVHPSLDASARRVRGIRPSLAWYSLSKMWLEGPSAPGP